MYKIINSPYGILCQWENNYFFFSHVDTVPCQAKSLVAKLELNFSPIQAFSKCPYVGYNSVRCLARGPDLCDLPGLNIDHYKGFVWHPSGQKSDSWNEPGAQPMFADWRELQPRTHFFVPPTSYASYINLQYLHLYAIDSIWEATLGEMVFSWDTLHFLSILPSLLPPWSIKQALKHLKIPNMRQFPSLLPNSSDSS